MFVIHNKCVHCGKLVYIHVESWSFLLSLSLASLLSPFFCQIPLPVFTVVYLSVCSWFLEIVSEWKIGVDYEGGRYVEVMLMQLQWKKRRALIPPLVDVIRHPSGLTKIMGSFWMRCQWKNGKKNLTYFPNQRTEELSWYYS